MIQNQTQNQYGTALPQSVDEKANIAQRDAANPEHCVWVGASAGTGKTKVLTDRVLRLLLPRENGREGTHPHRIVCLTFTKAAANEMAVRINQKLGQWAVMDIENVDPKKSLTHILHSLLGYEPQKLHVDAARRLFAEVVDCPGGLQIMTIHSFCQSILGRFPVEAGLNPNFQVIEDAHAKRLMASARAMAISKSQKPENSGSNLHQAMQNVIVDLDEKTFDSLISQIVKEKAQLQFFSHSNGLQKLYADICDFYSIAQDDNEEKILRKFCATSPAESSLLKDAAELLLQDTGKLAPARAENILLWLNAAEADRFDMFNDYQTAYLTKKGDIHKKSFPPAKIANSSPWVCDVLEKEAERVQELLQKRKSIKSAQLTRDLLIIGHHIAETYENLKNAEGGLDFDDLIHRTMELLTGATHMFSTLNAPEHSQVMPWIMYKLDQGIDHILVDEAQDTNPEQWKIIEALSSEFFSGLSARDDVLRTSFTVGDIKQSIYGFQRAAPDEFKVMQDVFHKRISEAKLINKNISLDVSFRSTESVLHAVDAVFQRPELQNAVGEQGISHNVFRQGQAGIVELWPLFETPKSMQRDFWDPPIDIHHQSSGSSELANYIAGNIRYRLDQKEVLESYGREIKPSDFMILVRSRSIFVDQLVRALKAQNVPVSGADRMLLEDQLAVQDMLSIARFCLFPENDLALAEILKSPLLGWSEEELFSIAYGRKGSLWQEICNFDPDRIKNIQSLSHPLCVTDAKREETRLYLTRLLGLVSVSGAFEFFSFILNEPCPADECSGLRAICKRLGRDAFDPIEEFMNTAIEFSHSHIDHIQNFIDYLDNTATEIKREMEDQTNQVRIMTIHGSKGLQSPIVILPDTIKNSAAKKVSRLLWPDKTGLSFPIFSSRKDDDPEKYKDVFERCTEKDDQEYYRLLYVAMTRASDHLYIAGYIGTKGAKENSWYYILKETFENTPRTEELENNILRISNPQTAKPDKRENTAEQKRANEKMPDWVMKKAQAEPVPPKPLVPSRPSEDLLEESLSPLQSINENRFARGNITHKLLEFLPDFENVRRRIAAQQFVAKNAGKLSRAVQQNIVEEVMNILEHTDYAKFFQKGSMAEVPITGLMPDNRIVSGQIDRLLVEERDIWIVDYKTNRPSPQNPQDVPLLYQNQLKAYKDALVDIYPKHQIHCGLLWTDGPHFMILDV